jgi:hypothetical protein
MAKVYQALASKLTAYRNCQKSGNRVFEINHHHSILEMVSEKLPSGSGFDNGTEFDMELSGDNRLVFHTDFHHMNDAGYYDGWTKHTVTIRPSFSGFDMTISGPNRNDIKDYIADAFHTALSADESE